MTSQEQRPSNGSTNKPRSEADSAKSSPKAFRPVLGQLEAQRQAEEDRKRRKRLKQARQKAQTEFKAWKRTLCKLINDESSLEFNEATLTWSFVVPAKLNRFFYEIMIKEYVRAKKAANEGDAARLVRQEFDAAADAALEAERILRERQNVKGEAKDDDDLGVSKEALDHEPDRARDLSDGDRVDNVGGDHA